MKRLALFLALASAAVSLEAAPFQNLGFDLANTNSLSPDPGSPLHGTGPTVDLLPGWELSKGGVPQSTLGLNLSSLSLGYATLISHDQSQFFGFDVDGAYALALIGSAGNQDPFSLSQRGDIPSDAKLLTFRYSGYPFLVTINGTPLTPLTQSTPLQAFDVSPFAGQTVDLSLTALGPPMPTQAGSSYIDTIAFAVPEPATWILLGWAGALLLLATGASRHWALVIRTRCHKLVGPRSTDVPPRPILLTNGTALRRRQKWDAVERVPTNLSVGAVSRCGPLQPPGRVEVFQDVTSLSPSSRDRGAVAPIC